MISAKFLKNSARMSLKLNGTTEHVYGQVSKSELQSRLAGEMKEACKACREKLNLPKDKFEKI